MHCSTCSISRSRAAEAELERDVRQTFLKVLVGGSIAGGSRERSASVGMVRRDGGLFSDRPAPATLPNWLTEADLIFTSASLSARGFAAV